MAFLRAGGRAVRRHQPLPARESVVIGAHYDHLGVDGASKLDLGKVHPGADDNASGAAMLLDLASRLMLVANMERPVVFVAFTGEETGRKGSSRFADSVEDVAYFTRVTGIVRQMDDLGCYPAQ